MVQKSDELAARNLAILWGADADGVGGRIGLPQIRSRSREIAAIGDSRNALQWAVANDGGSDTFGYGHLMWSSFLSGGRVEFPSALNFAVSGYTTEQILAAVPACITAMRARGATTVVYIGSTNDRNAGWDATRTITAIDAAAALFRDAGIEIIWLATSPRGNGSFSSLRLTATQLAYELKVRRHLLLRAEQYRGEYTIDPWEVMADRSTTTGDVLAGMTTDGLHFALIDGSYVGKQLADLFVVLYPARPKLTMSNADVAGANFDHGNFVSNPCFLGTAGTAEAGVTGSVPSSWTSKAPISGLAVAASIATVGGARLPTFAITGTAASASSWDLLRQDVSTGFNGLAVGQTYRIEWPLDWDACANISHIQPFLLANNLWRRHMRGSTGLAWPSEARSGVMISDPFTVPAGSTLMRFGLNIQTVAAVATSLTIRVGEPSVRRID